MELCDGDLNYLMNERKIKVDIIKIIKIFFQYKNKNKPSLILN